LDDKVVKALQNKIVAFEAEISKLKENLENKEKETANLANFKDDLSSELEETKRKLVELENIVSDVDKLKNNLSSKDEEINNLRAQVDKLKPKVAELTKTNEELKISGAEAEIKLKELSERLTEKEKAFDEQKSKLEKAETELSTLKPVTPTEYTSEERLVCPKCGARGKDLKVEEDKSKVLGYVGHSPLYSKKHVCKKCGCEF